MLSLEEQQLRLPYLLSYYGETAQRNKLLTVLEENKTLPIELIKQARSAPPETVKLQAVNRLLEKKKLNQESEDASEVWGFSNGQITFSLETHLPNLRSLGVGSHSVALSEIRHDDEGEKIVDPKTGTVYLPLRSGLYISATSLLQKPPTCEIRVQPSNLFESFHSNCKTTCDMASLMSPFPGDLCARMKQFLVTQTHERKHRRNTLQLQVKMTLEQAKQAFHDREQYGFLFSGVIVHIDELFEKNCPSEGSNLSFQFLTFLTATPGVLGTTQVLQKVADYLEKAQRSANHVYVILTFAAFERSSNFCVPPILVDPKLKIVFLKVKLDDFESWFAGQKLIEQLTSKLVSI